MSTDFSNFLAMPKQEHHLRRSVFLLVILAVIIILAWAYTRFTVSTPSSTQPLTEEVPQAVDQRVTLSPAEAEEKQKMLETADTSRVKLTKEEIKAKELELQKLNLQ